MTEQQKILQVEYAAWIRNPVTKQVMKLLQQHSESIVKAIASAATDDKNFTDAKVRNFGVQLATVQTINNIIFNEEKFISKSGGG